MSRRGENIYKRKDGRWEGRYIKERNISGRIIYGYLYAKTYSEVKQKLKENQVKNVKEKVQTVNAYSIPFSELCNLWLKRKSLEIKQSTYAKYFNILNAYILPEIGNLITSQIERETLQNFAYSIINRNKQYSHETLSSQTVRDIASVFKSVLFFAAEEGYLPKFDIRFFQPKQKEKRVKVLSSDEQIKLVQYLVNNIDFTKLGILICLSTGIRLGELCALKKENISLENHIIMIRYTLQRITDTDTNSLNKTKIIIDTPKSSTSIRDIPIPVFLWEYCYQILHDLPEDAYLLSGKRKEFMEPRTCQNRFKKCIKDCGINDINFHALRHSFATKCIENHFDIKSLSEILGHSNVNITLNKYVHPSMELKRAYMDTINFPCII